MYCFDNEVLVVAFMSVRRAAAIFSAVAAPLGGLPSATIGIKPPAREEGSTAGLAASGFIASGRVARSDVPLASPGTCGTSDGDTMPWSVR